MMKSILSLIAAAIPLCAYAQEYKDVKFNDIDEMSRIIINETVDFINPRFDCLSNLFINISAKDEKMAELNGKIIQYKAASLKEWGMVNKGKAILVGSKSLPGIIKVIYLVDAENYPIPVSISWLEKDGSYRVAAFYWGSQVYQDLNDLSQKWPGAIKSFDQGSAQQVDAPEPASPAR